MNFILDIHCHTVASGHAYSTLNENVRRAAERGLALTGVADHAPSMPGGAHMYHFVNLRCLPDEINGVRVLKGAEVNIMDTDGALDLPQIILQGLDFVIASLHKGAFPPTDKASHTQALLRVMENPFVHIIGHPGDPNYPIDVNAVTEAAQRTGTILEINNHSLEPDGYRSGGEDTIREILARCAALSVPVLASSDAHVDVRVGDMALAQALIEESGIDESLVLNTDVDRLLAALKGKRR